MSNTIVDFARLYAHAAHAAVGQMRNDKTTQYIEHPRRVAAILTTVVHTQEMKAAAWLHDVVEDTAVTLDDLRLHFSAVVVQHVDDLTKRENMLNKRSMRKRLECARLGDVSDDSKTIKLADIIDNLGDMQDSTPEFQEIFVREKSQLLPYLKGGDPVLMFRADKMIKEYYDKT